MAIVGTPTRKIQTQGGDASPNGGTYTQSRTHTYQVTVDGSGDTDATILASALLPQPRDAHPDGGYLRVARRTVRKISYIFYEVDVEYDSVDISFPGHSPLDMRAKVEFYAELVEEEIDIDINGDAIIMVTGEEFKPRPREMRAIPIISVEKNVMWVSPEVIADYTWATNSDTWRGMPPGTCLIKELHATEMFDNDLTYYKVTAKIALRRAAPGSTDARAWWMRLRAQGFLVKISTGFGDFFMPALSKGKGVTEPVLHEVATGVQITNNALAEWYEFETKKSRSFAYLGLL